MLDGRTDDKVVDTAHDDPKIVVKFPTVDGRGIDRKTLDRFLNEVEASLYDLEKEELKVLVAEINKKWGSEKQWQWATHAAFSKLATEYAGRRFQIVAVAGDGLAFEIAVTAAAFGVLREAVDHANITPRLDGTRRGLQNRAEHSHATTLVVCRERLLKSSMFHVQMDDRGKKLLLTAKLEPEDRALPTMKEFVATARKKTLFDSLISLVA
jgi:hypothetical protein